MGPNTAFFDIENKSHWVPFMDEKNKNEYFKNGIETIQTELIYEETDQEWCVRLEKKLQYELCKKIINERANNENGKRPRQTKFDDMFAQRIRNVILTSFEAFKYTTRTTGVHSTLNPKSNTKTSMEQIEQLRDEIFRQFDSSKSDVYGIPLNMPYTSTDKIWQAIKNTDIHNIDSNDIDYVLSVAVHPYPHYVISVWVYVGVIFTKPHKIF